ncbi:MAG: DUF432 domain-containing protein [Methanomicrobiales archaeon]
MYGTYHENFSYMDPDISLSFSGPAGTRRYIREYAGKRVEKNLASDTGRILINPVEPVNLPDGLTSHLEISFDPVIIKPGDEPFIYLKFPVETAVFLESGGAYDVLDIFSLVPTKYSLYGLPETGCITKWYRSGVYTEIPETDPLREGVIELRFRNSGAVWAEVSRAVFQNTDMHLYYGDMVSMAAVMEIWNPKLARTSFLRRPLISTMTPSVELYTARKIPIVQQSGYVMEQGIS